MKKLKKTGEYLNIKKSIKRNYQKKLKRNYEVEKYNSWKNSLDGFNRRFEQRKESVKLVTGLIKLSSLKNRKKKRMKSE